MVQALHIRGAQIWNGKENVQRDLFTTEVVTPKPAPNALSIDLSGYTLFPGLINAHDHLELNHYPRSKFRDRYDNAHQWGEDMNARLDTEPFKSLRVYPLEDRCFIGGLKNLLCGAITVAHHNPPHKCLFNKDFPVRVLRKYGWAHSLHFSTDDEILRSYKSTPKDVPWFIHLAEGTDEESASEYERLKALGCIGENTVLIHGVNILSPTFNTIFPDAKNCRGLVWCPSTNFYLLDQTANIFRWSSSKGKVAIGSDSRLTADGDLLSEINVVREKYAVEPPMEWVTSMAAEMLGMQGVGSLDDECCADYIALRRDTPDINKGSNNPTFRSRADLALVVKGGVPQIGDPDMMAKFPHIQAVSAILDGKPKAIHTDLARRIQKCSLKELGLEVERVPERKLFGFIVNRDALKRESS